VELSELHPLEVHLDDRVTRVDPLWFENEAPSTTSRSASFMIQLATGVPLRPSTPQASGCSSPIWPLALKVVITGAPSCSARAVTSSIASRAP
jgi:hypothetical protein